MRTTSGEIVETLPRSFQVHSKICMELMRILDDIMRIFPDIEDARPKCSSGIESLVYLNNSIQKAKLLLQHCSECSKLYLAVTGDTVLLRFQKAKKSLEQSLIPIQSMVPVVLAVERLVHLWALESAERDAFLVEIACTRSSDQLFSAKKAYHVLYKKSIEEDVAHHTTGDYRKLLLPLVSSHRYEGDEVNLTIAKAEAKILHEKISKKAYNDDDLIRILATRSKAQVNATLNHYKDAFGKDINKDLKEDPKDEFLSLLRSTVKCLTRPEKYFAKIVRLSINKHGTDEGALTRVVATRAEIDLKIVADEYQRRDSVPLDRAIVKDTTGDYEKMLLALLGHNDA
ncbi:unnamed protein product [Vicia faba]|uniref:Annexin n=1 Tax=Vicia faba TaxID=3906 RepID=A0AAV0ZEK6_VICFA|nr:unnamed protein product [Vicia faba]